MVYILHLCELLCFNLKSFSLMVGGGQIDDKRWMNRLLTVVRLIVVGASLNGLKLKKLIIVKKCDNGRRTSMRPR